MFLEHALTQTVDLQQPLRVLDLCAAPGGKSTHLQSLLSPQSLLVSNEVIKARAGILKGNIVKWGCHNVIVTSNDPQHFQKLEGFFDVVVVDAPCSGSGLFRKDEDAISEWSPQNVQLCSGRQQRILADALPCLKENGILIYSTCSYSVEEDEDICDWLADALGMEGLPLPVPAEWGIVETASQKAQVPGYRFFPHRLRGEGFFLAAFRKRRGGASKSFRPGKPETVSRAEREALRSWIEGEELFEFMKHSGSVFAWPRALVPDLQQLQQSLYIQYTGVMLGELIRDKLIPHHALAMSPLLARDAGGIDLSYEEAIRYLQRGDLQLSDATRGWQLARYKSTALGWINVLPNRINNYYPKELRILKHHDSSFEK
jgi:NOL1/NOP2/fmu family ribosome biogenesis protein